MIVTCPVCFSADDVTATKLPDSMIDYSCSRDHDGTGPHDWIGSSEAANLGIAAGAGVTDELLDPLSECVFEGEPFVEYGVVEYRFARKRPDLYASHIADRGHSMLGPKQGTASGARFALALGRLARSGELVSKYGPATGAWSYNGQVSYWARPPAPTTADRSWIAFCESLGRTADWTDEDRSLAAGTQA